MSRRPHVRLTTVTVDPATSTRAGDSEAFLRAGERHRRELQVHCYRLLGSVHDAEDAVQETFLRAWARIGTYEGRASWRAWLYRIATNVCLDVLRRRGARAWATDVAAPADPAQEPAAPTEIDWLQPYPDRLLPVATGDPEAVAVARETIELVFTASLQRLPARQRAVLVLRDVLGWTARETADALEASVPAVNSSLQRARATLVRHAPAERGEWRVDTSPRERALVARLMTAWERADAQALVGLLDPDVRLVMPPRSTWFAGREDVGEFFRGHVFGALGPGWQLRPTSANRQPAVELHLRRPGQPRRPFGVAVLTIHDDAVTELAVFTGADVLATFGLRTAP